jgi:hypothetical protein
MKKAIAFVKKRWPLIVSVVVILVALPAAWVVSGNLNAKLKGTQEKAANDLYGQLDGMKVTYELPAPVDGMEPVTESGVMPHPKLTEFFREQQQAQSGRLSEATQAIIAFNSKGRGALVEGLFPKEPEDNSEAQLLRLRMQSMLIPGGGRSAYEQLLASVNATTPPDPQGVLEQLNDTAARLREREAAQSGAAELDPEEQEAMKQELTAQRVSLYARPAQEHSIYLSLDEFPEGSPRSVGPAFPRQAMAEPPSQGWTFLWQLDYWLAQDIIGFLKTANSRNDALLPIVDAPIKRVLELEARPLNLNRLSSRGQYDDAIDMGPDAASQVFEPRYFASPSGREADWLNQLYDIRKVSISLVVDSARIPLVLDAASKQNLISVVDLDIQPVDVWRDLEQGYYYGQDHVVRLDLELEFVYLRAWTAPLMPNIISQELGLPPHPEPEEDEGFGEDPGIG